MITKSYKFHPQPSSILKSTKVAKMADMRGKAILDCFCGCGSHGVSSILGGARVYIGTDIEDYSFCLRKDIARYNHNHKTFGDKTIIFEWGIGAMESINNHNFDILFTDPPNPYQVAGGTRKSVIRDTGLSGSKLTKFWNARFSSDNWINKKDQTIQNVITVFNETLLKERRIVANLFTIKSSGFNYCDVMAPFDLKQIYDSYYEVLLK
jgi:16S rRNA G966 N2-methylase RsmD